MIERLERAIFQAQEEGYLTKTHGDLILDTARLEFREAPDCPMPRLFLEFLESPGPYPTLTRDLLLNTVMERRIYFRDKKGWLSPTEPSIIQIKY